MPDYLHEILDAKGNVTSYDIAICRGGLQGRKVDRDGIIRSLPQIGHESPGYKNWHRLLKLAGLPVDDKGALVQPLANYSSASQVNLEWQIYRAAFERSGRIVAGPLELVSLPGLLMGTAAVSDWLGNALPRIEAHAALMGLLTSVASTGFLSAGHGVCIHGVEDLLGGERVSDSYIKLFVLQNVSRSVFFDHLRRDPIDGPPDKIREEHVLDDMAGNDGWLYWNNATTAILLQSHGVADSFNNRVDVHVERVVHSAPGAVLLDLNGHLPWPGGRSARTAHKVREVFLAALCEMVDKREPKDEGILAVLRGVLESNIPRGPYVL